MWKLILLTIVITGLLDGLWIGLVASRLYRRVLKGIILDQPRGAAAGLFYVVFIAGLVGFIVLPHAGHPTDALLAGLAFGAVAYSTFSLTNLALLKQWTWGLALSDIAWGAVLSGVTAWLVVLWT